MPDTTYSYLARTSQTTHALDTSDSSPKRRSPRAQQVDSPTIHAVQIHLGRPTQLGCHLAVPACAGAFRPRRLVLHGPRGLSRRPRRTIQLLATVALQAWMYNEQGPLPRWQDPWCQVLLLAALECAIPLCYATPEPSYLDRITGPQKDLPGKSQKCLVSYRCQTIYRSRRLGVDHQVFLELDGHSSAETVFVFDPLLKGLAACLPVLPWHFLVPGNHHCLWHLGLKAWFTKLCLYLPDMLCLRRRAYISADCGTLSYSCSAVLR